MAETNQGPTEESAPEETTNEATETETETPETSADETGETAEAKGEKAEGEPPAGEGKTEGESEEPRPDEKHRRAGGWQRKIERLERENQLLLEHLSSQRTGQQSASAAPSKEKTAEEKATEYIESLVEQRLAARETKQQEMRAQAEFQRRTAEVRAQNPDFDDVVMSADMPVSPAVRQALLTSELGPAIMYQLAKNPAELARISALPPLDAAREIGRLEAKASSTAAPAAKPKSATRPPAPPTSVGGSASSTRSLEDLPLSEYKRAMRSGRR